MYPDVSLWELISSIETYLKILGEPMLVIRIELTNVFNKLFDRNGFHVICGNKMIFRITKNSSIKQITEIRVY